MAKLYRRACTIAAIAATGTSIACGGKPSAKASPPDTAHATKTAAGVVADAGAPSGAAVGPSDATARSRMFSGADTSAKLIAGRTKMDASSYASAIRAGDKAMTNWPTDLRGIAGRDSAGESRRRVLRQSALEEDGRDRRVPRAADALDARQHGRRCGRTADPSTPVIPAIHLVAVVAQGAPGPDGGWRRRESADMIEKSYGWAKSRKGLLILDIQARPQHARQGAAAAAQVSRAPGRAPRHRPRVLHALQA